MAYMDVDGCLTSETFNASGNQFAYYLFESELADYYGMYERILSADLPSPYQVDDSWDNYEKLDRVLDATYTDWLHLQ